MKKEKHRYTACSCRLLSFLFLKVKDMKKFLLFVFLVVIIFATNGRAQGSLLPSSASINADSLTIYPNPCHGSVNVTVYGRVGEILTLSVYNSLGTEIFKPDSELITKIITNKKVDLLPLPTLRGICCFRFIFTKNNGKDKEIFIKKVVVN